MANGWLSTASGYVDRWAGRYRVLFNQARIRMSDYVDTAQLSLLLHRHPRVCACYPRLYAQGYPQEEWASPPVPISPAPLSSLAADRARCCYTGESTITCGGG